MKSLKGISVVNCRSRHQAAPLDDALLKAGATPIAMPLLEVTQPSDGGRALLSALAALENFDWVLFTSTNAVHAVVEAAVGKWPDQTKVGSVGTATTRVLERSEIPVHYTSLESTADDLGKSLPLTDGRRVLTPLGDRADSALSDALVARGATVSRVEAYRTLDADPGPSVRARAAEADYVFLTSPAIAIRFSQVVGTGPKAVCIGPTTAKAAEELGFNVHAVATNRSPDGLISALVNTIS